MNIIEEEHVEVPYGELTDAQKRARAAQKRRENQEAAARGTHVIDGPLQIIGRVDPNGQPYPPPLNPDPNINVIPYGGKKRRTRRSKRKQNKRRTRQNKRKQHKRR